MTDHAGIVDNHLIDDTKFLLAACKEQCARIAELEAALNHLWDAAITVSHDGDSGCFVHEANWRKAMSVGPMKSKK